MITLAIAVDMLISRNNVLNNGILALGVLQLFMFKKKDLLSIHNKEIKNYNLPIDSNYFIYFYILQFTKFISIFKMAELQIFLAFSLSNSYPKLIKMQ